MNDQWRCFVAVPLDGALRRSLEDGLRRLRDEHAELDEAWRWTAPDSWHVTLAFLGSTQPADVDRITAAISAVVREHSPFSVRTGGLGAFPSRRAARVLWYGVTDRHGEVAGLSQALAAALGLETGPLHHVTLARARHRHGVPLGDLLDGAWLPPGELRIDRALLLRSHLGRGPARYEPVAESPMNGGVRA